MSPPEIDPRDRTTILVHYYRAMVGRADIWRTRMDTTTNWAIGALGILVAVVTGVISLYRYQELWVDYRLTAETLQQEKYRFLTGVPPYDTEPAMAVLVDRVESVLSEQNSQWQQLTKEKQEAESDAA